MKTTKHLRSTSEKNNKNNKKVRTRHREINFNDTSLNCFM